MMHMPVRKARMPDVRNIHGLLLGSTGEGTLLPRSLSDIYGHLRDFFVLHDQDGSLVGCAALTIVWENLAEIRSLFIDPGKRTCGGGSLLVNACLEEAAQLGLNKVFALTYRVDFFARHGFRPVSKDVLPQKVWMDCIHCPKFPDCDETAVLLEMS
jgi:amino-acid N-acetyltransferase